MLETCVNQGAGLLSIAAHATPRVIAMASHGDQQGELPLLWSLCSTLVDFGHTVAVLDATTRESDDNPGLKQLLDDDPARCDDSGEPLSWSVIPAAFGLKQLCREKSTHELPLAPLHGLVEDFGVIIIYARANMLAQLLPNSGVEPLLTLTQVKMSQITAYQALKQMLLTAQLRPTVATIASELHPKKNMTSQPPLKNLQECAMTFLGYRLDSLAVRAYPQGDCESDDMHRLALRLLENAMPLHRNHFVGTH